MRITLLLSAITCLTLGQQEPDPAQLLDADRAFYVDTHERGLEGWLDWFAADSAILTVEGELLSGPDEIRAYYASIHFPPEGFSWSPEHAELAESGELGYTTGTWELRPPGAPDGVDLPGGKYLSVWKRQPDGAFRVLVDSGGNPDFRTRLEELAGPPLEWSSQTDRFELAESGELAIAIGTWTARTADSEQTGKYLTIWKRADEDVWEIASEIGFSH